MKKITIEIDEETANKIQVIGYEGLNFTEEIALMVDHICNCKKYWEEYKKWREEYYT